MVAKLMCYNFKFHHIPGKSNKIADCFSRVTRRIRETEHYDITDPILADHATIKKVPEFIYEDLEEEDTGREEGNSN